MRRLAVLAVLVSSVAFAQEHEPHTGFFLHGDVGFGAIIGNSSDGYSLSGSVFTTEVAIGGSIGHGWELSGMGAYSDTLSATATAPGGATDTSLTFEMWMVAPKATYYFLGPNVYVSLAAGIGQMSNDVGSTLVGPAFEVSSGKEWLLGSHWGLGIAGKVFLLYNQKSGGSPDGWVTAIPAVVFSATLN